jgi:nucleoporin NDC1
MISASVFEDRFGVVQKQLPKILTSMLTLQQTVERHKGLTTNLKKPPRSDIRDVELKLELKCAIKTSLYRITTSFGEHISAVPLAPEFKQKIENYKMFLEG